MPWGRKAHAVVVHSQLCMYAPQAGSFTNGVHLCSTLHAPSPGAPRLAFVDVEGQGDRGKDIDVRLATPLLMLSKVIIFCVHCPAGPAKEVCL